MPAHAQIKEALLKFKKVMDKAGIIFWLEYGTLLGAVREGKIIEWDTDGDVGVWIDDIPKMRKLEKEFLAEGLRVDYQPTHPYVALKISDRESILVIDICTFDIIQWKNKKWIARIVEGKLLNIKADEFTYRHFKKINFLGTDFYIPFYAENALEFLYGKNWRTPIRRDNSKTPTYGKNGWAKRVQLEDLK
jgi:hypothetical protein